MNNRLKPPRTLRDPDASLAETLEVLAAREGFTRRRLLQALGALAIVAGPAQAATTCTSLTVIPTETNGPYPADGTNGVNVLTQSGIVRSDIRSSFGSYGTTTATGTPTTLTLTLLSTVDGCTPLAGYAVYVWHCDASGRYSLYSSGVTSQNYLRGVQVSDSEGKVTFTTIFPACYSGRWPHIHFEVYENTAAATSGKNALKISQVAMPAATCNTVYAQSSLYPSSASNLTQVTLATDNVFGDDGGVHELASVSGSVSAGLAVSLDVGLAENATTYSAIVPDEGIWWTTGGTESGWGINISQQDSALFCTWFTFATDGSPWWMALRCDVSATNTYSGTIYSGSGPAFTSVPFDSSAVVAEQVGSATLTFTSKRAATFAYTVNGVSQTKSIALEVFGSSVPTCTWSADANLAAATNYQDMWWNASESGWGLNIAHQGDTIYATWFTFGSNGKPLWMVFGAPKVSTGVYTGDVYTGTGPAFSAVPFSPSQVVGEMVGTATLTFSDGNHATFKYIINGTTQTKAITREIYGSSGGTVCV